MYSAGNSAAGTGYTQQKSTAGAPLNTIPTHAAIGDVPAPVAARGVANSIVELPVVPAAPPPSPEAELQNVPAVSRAEVFVVHQQDTDRERVKREQKAVLKLKRKEEKSRRRAALIAIATTIARQDGEQNTSVDAAFAGVRTAAAAGEIQIAGQLRTLQIVKDESKKDRVVRKIRRLMEGIIEALTDFARLLEKLDDDNAKVAERKTAAQDLLKQYVKKLTKLDALIPDSVVHRFNLPLGLINHVDAFQSPNVWLSELYSQATRQNDIARGELLAIGSLQATLTYYLKHDGEAPLSGVVPATPLVTAATDTGIITTGNDNASVTALASSTTAAASSAAASTTAAASSAAASTTAAASNGNVAHAAGYTADML
eukprot:Lankesteria_metandrocarpae@DN3366_c0_g1_i1.p1